MKFFSRFFWTNFRGGGGGSAGWSKRPTFANFFSVFFGPNHGEGGGVPPVGPKDQLFPFFLLKAPLKRKSCREACLWLTTNLYQQSNLISPLLLVGAARIESLPPLPKAMDIKHWMTRCKNLHLFSTAGLRCGSTNCRALHQDHRLHHWLHLVGKVKWSNFATEMD